MKKMIFAGFTLLFMMSCSMNQTADPSILRSTLALKELPSYQSELTQKVVAEADQKLIRLTFENTQTNYFAARVVQSNGVDMYMTSDKRSISIQDGKVIALRGFGFDLLSRGGVERRLYHFADGNHQSIYYSAVCKDKNLVSDTIRILNMATATMRRDSHCHFSDLAITEATWRNASYEIIQVKQWLGPKLGIATVQWLN